MRSHNSALPRTVLKMGLWVKMRRTRSRGKQNKDVNSVEVLRSYNRSPIHLLAISIPFPRICESGAETKIVRRNGHTEPD